MPRTTGIHHITSFVQDPQGNVDFYAGVLGLRLVKKTINFDAPDVYHFYFGNEAGSPGTIMTFFPHQDARRGSVGGGQVGISVFAVPPGSLDFWKERLTGFAISFDVVQRFGEQYIRFHDNSGLLLEITEREEGTESRWSFGGVPADKAIKGFGGAVLFSMKPDRTGEILNGLLGLERVNEEGGWVRYQASGDIGQIIDMNTKDLEWGRGGAGTVHHIAWRAADNEQQEQFRQEAEAGRLQPTPVVDRQYFNAVYFREPGGILFEIATDPPGFANDEPAEHLGEKIMLPSWFEPHREELERNLTPVEVRVLKGAE
ncbi:ring-cleaving dioxygenase [Paenibacillus lemnae]|uniref:Ring-cleaving dioxygenase n=1 Tax=Paenibacillus lemnae TaxID=1330551 RepID=A0A848MB93_PAELE|nr:ring-cleaving dioxygenase [Paenibacillus lemnae]NMO97430.1 ring-cleaving dioxygenase [Paenibacillus lemnae]